MRPFHILDITLDVEQTYTWEQIKQRPNWHNPITPEGSWYVVVRKDVKEPNFLMENKLQEFRMLLIEAATWIEQAEEFVTRKNSERQRSEGYSEP